MTQEEPKGRRGTKLIATINLQRINNGAHVMFMRTMLNYATEDEALAGRIAPLVDALRKAMERENVCMRKSRKSLLTNQIAQADEERGRLYMGYKKAVMAFSGFPDEEVADAAWRLAQHIKDFRINPRMQRDAETGLMMKFIRDLEGRMKRYVDTLSLGIFAVRLRENNDRLIDLTVNRDNETLAQPGTGAMRKARAATDGAFRELALMVNSLAVVEGGELYATFIEQANQLIAKYKREVIRRRGAAKADGATEAADAAEEPSDSAVQPAAGAGRGDDGNN